MAWAAIPALLKTRYGVNEILSSLMLVYVALQVLNYLVAGPWKDPNGHNFPQTAPFTAAQRLPAVARTAVPAGALRRLRAGAGVLGGHGALGIWLCGARRRRGAEGGALRRLRASARSGRRC